MLTRVALPVVVALVAASWLLWTRGAPERQGGYCMNATVEVAALLRRADAAGSDDVGRGPLPPPEQILAQVDRLDPERFAVNTPPELRDDVARLEGPERQGAFAVIIADYLDRCRAGG